MIDKVMVFDISGKVILENKTFKIPRGHTFRFKPIRAGFQRSSFIVEKHFLKNYLLETKKIDTNPIRCLQWIFP
jgi:hypothetical protein